MSNDASNDVKDKGGRPTKLTDELIAKAEMYLTDYPSNDDIVPTVAGLACYLNIPRSSLYNYKGQDYRLLDTLERIEQLQEKMLVKGGLLGDFNPTITKLMMSNHGYSEKAQVDNVSSDGSMTPITLTPEEVIERMKEKRNDY
jgi:hypothetical protein